METDSAAALESRVKAAVASALGLAKLLHISSAKRGPKTVTVMAAVFSCDGYHHDGLQQGHMLPQLPHL